MYPVSKKTRHSILAKTSPNIERFSKYSFTSRLCSECVTKWPLKLPPHLNCVARCTTVWNLSVQKRAPWKNRICFTTMKLRKSLVKPVTRQKTCNRVFSSSARHRHARCISCYFLNVCRYASCMTISGERTEQRVIILVSWLQSIRIRSHSLTIVSE